MKRKRKSPRLTLGSIVNWRTVRVALFVVLIVGVIVFGIVNSNRSPVVITRYERQGEVGCSLTFKATWVEAETYFMGTFVRRQVFGITDIVLIRVLPSVSNTVYLYDSERMEVQHILEMKPDCSALHITVTSSDE